MFPEEPFLMGLNKVRQTIVNFEQKKKSWCIVHPTKLDPDASASDAKSLFHWLRGRCMPMKRMKRIQFS